MRTIQNLTVNLEGSILISFDNALGGCDDAYFTPNPPVDLSSMGFSNNLTVAALAIAVVELDARLKALESRL